jgi:hypothetical protein
MTQVLAGGVIRPRLAAQIVEGEAAVGRQLGLDPFPDGREPGAGVRDRV